jgi:hypothetical protein
MGAVLLFFGFDPVVLRAISCPISEYPMNWKKAMLRRFGAITLAGVAGLLLVACGGGNASSSGGGSADSSGNQVSKAVFVKQATAICHQAGVKRNRLMTSISGSFASAGGVSVATEQTELAMKAIVPVEKEMVARLAELEPPAAEQVTIARIVEGFENGIQRIEGKPSIPFESVVVTAANVEAEKYGLPECFV